MRITTQSEKTLRIRGNGSDQSWRLEELQFSTRIANTPRTIHLPGGGQCATAKYSHPFELEADRYAMRFLDNHDIARKHFAAILQRLSDLATPSDEGLLSCLATRLDAALRLERIPSP